MSRCKSLLLFLTASLANGCRQEPPRSAPSGSTAAEQIMKRVDMEFAAVYVILPKSGPRIVEFGYDKLQAALTPLLDDPRIQQVVTGRSDISDGYLGLLTIGPVKDVETLGNKQTLGSVVAYDPAKRALLIEYGAARAARNAWKDAAYLDRQVTALKARSKLELQTSFWSKGIPLWSKEHPAQQVVCVLWPENQPPPWGVTNKLFALLDGPPEKRTGPNWWQPPVVRAGITTWPDKEWMTWIAPVMDLEALTKKIDFAQVIFCDTQHNVLILGEPSNPW